MLRKSSCLPLAVFYSSMGALYVQPLLVPRTLSLLPGAVEWLALAALAGSSLSLASWATPPRPKVLGFVYPVAALVAGAGYFMGLEELTHIGDTLEFHRRQPRLAAHMAALATSRQALAAARAATATGRHRGYLAVESGFEGYDVLPSRIVLCTIGGAVSQHYWGYAYAPAGLPPQRGGRRRGWGTVLPLAATGRSLVCVGSK